VKAIGGGDFGMVFYTFSAFEPGGREAAILRADQTARAGGGNAVLIKATMLKSVYSLLRKTIFVGDDAEKAYNSMANNQRNLYEFPDTDVVIGPLGVIRDGLSTGQKKPVVFAG
jgi:hypothetical protein